MPYHICSPTSSPFNLFPRHHFQYIYLPTLQKYARDLVSFYQCKKIDTLAIYLSSSKIIYIYVGRHHVETIQRFYMPCRILDMPIMKCAYICKPQKIARHHLLNIRPTIVIVSALITIYCLPRPLFFIYAIRQCF